MDVYDEYLLVDRTCQKWFASFKTDFGWEDEERAGWPKKFKDAELEILLQLKIISKRQKSSQNL